MKPSIALVACCLMGAGCATPSAATRPALPPASTASGAGAQPTSADPAAAPDPTVTDPDKYQVILENGCVRVLRYHDQPGAVTKAHHHRSFVMVALAPFERELLFPDGRRQKRAFRQGEVVWVPAQTHAGHNIGSQDTEGLLVEIKACQPPS